MASFLVLDDGVGSTALLVSDLTSLGHTVTTASESTYAGTPDASSFDATIHLNGEDPLSDVPLAGQSSLVSAVLAGRGYVSGAFNASDFDSGRHADLGDLTILRAGGGGATDQILSATLDPCLHPILSGSPIALNTDPDLVGVESVALELFWIQPAEILATDSTGNPLLAIRKYGQGSVVQFSFAPNSSTATDGLALVALRNLWLRAALWSAGVLVDQTCREEALDCVKAARQELADAGFRPYNVKIQKRRWDGGAPGCTPMVIVSEIEIIPPPKIESPTPRYLHDRAGLVEAGDVRVLSKVDICAYDEITLTGDPTAPLEEVVYLIGSVDTGEVDEYRLVGKPEARNFEWILRVQRMNRKITSYSSYGS